MRGETNYYELSLNFNRLNYQLAYKGKIKDYKHFLRIKLEPDRATIYAIAIDKVPGRRGWRSELYPGESRPSHDPQIMPVKPLDPFLVEEIRIDASRPVS